LEIVGLDPREITSELYLNTYASVNLTATLNLDVFKILTRIHKKDRGYREIIATTPFNSKNVRALIIEGINTKKNYRTTMMYDKIVERIEEVISTTPKNIGIFCASYEVLEGLLISGIKEVVKKHKEDIFIEEKGKSSYHNSIMISKFKEMADSSEGGVLLGVCGGRNSEGEDFRGNYMNAVIIVGIPYVYPSTQTITRIKYYNKEFNERGYLLGYEYPAIQKVNQAAGRPIRREDDKAAIIFMDSRFKSKIPMISDWIQKEIDIIPDEFGVLSSNLKKFWK
jgi:DNA excision repair protein ERCC-2